MTIQTASSALKKYVLNMVADDDVVPTARLQGIRNQTAVREIMTRLGYRLSTVGLKAVYVKQGTVLPKHHCGLEKSKGIL